MSYSRDSLVNADLTHRFTTEIRPVYNMPTHGFYNGYKNDGKVIDKSASLHFKYSFAFSENTAEGSGFPSVYQGIGLGINSFFSHKEVGTPVALYLFQGGELMSLSEKWSLGYEWNFGLSCGWKINAAVGSKRNAYINISIPFIWKPSPEWEVQIGPEYTHFSNGDTKYPNGGANTAGLRIGMTRVHGKATSDNLGMYLFRGDDGMKDVPFRDRMNYDIILYGAWRADRIVDGFKLYLNNNHFPLFGLGINPLYRLNRYFLVGPSLDIQTDTSANLFDPVVSSDENTVLDYSSPGIWKQTSCGLSLRGELQMPFFSINIGSGYNFICHGYDMKRYYTTFNLKTFIKEKVYFCIGYRLSSLQYTHNLIFGIGFRI